MTNIIGKNSGFITVFVIYLFNLLKFVSLMKILSFFIPAYKSRGELNESEFRNSAFTHKRALLIDLYVSFWIFFSIISFIFLSLLQHSFLPCYLKEFILVFSLIRIIEILQVNINLTIFDNIKRPDQIVANSHRAVIMIVINYA